MGKVIPFKVKEVTDDTEVEAIVNSIIESYTEAELESIRLELEGEADETT